MFKAPDSLAEQIASHIAERIIYGELKAKERIQEQKVTQALDVSRGSVREALLILERRHLVVILPRRGAHVAELTPEKVRSLYAIGVELYILLASAVVDNWESEAELKPFEMHKAQLRSALERDDIRDFISGSFNILRATFPFARNPYLQQIIEDLVPAVTRTYYLSLEKRKGEMHKFFATFDSLLQAMVSRDKQAIRQLLLSYAEHNCQLVLAALEDS
ncbi:GntR family transcriptional regulator [Pseudomonas sp. TTU2014-080ASC]|uniref:GntR family transcriptional regulator n=1 Tax=Pseudomonas sp. TTU2014-080ASC TaxID=1729724 RepID=UPI0007184F96|nr:GntR family transcriptional regulator [Pseudomonas sp. TTU2014-080ASC]KRW61884.1 GntR family transcriptional regulator [Pseudomonas sp. TTU2014-080ASC]